MVPQLLSSINVGELAILTQNVQRKKKLQDYKKPEQHKPGHKEANHKIKNVESE